MRKLLRDLKRQFPDARIIRTTGANHYAITLGNGAVVIVSNSPSAQNYLRNVIADVRRQLKKTDQPASFRSTKE